MLAAADRLLITATYPGPTLGTSKDGGEGDDGVAHIKELTGGLGAQE